MYGLPDRKGTVVFWKGVPGRVSYFIPFKDYSLKFQEYEVNPTTGEVDGPMPPSDQDLTHCIKIRIVTDSIPRREPF
jgi:hypothetical protein